VSNINGLSQVQILRPRLRRTIGLDAQKRQTMTARILAQRGGEGELCDEYARVPIVGYRTMLEPIATILLPNSVARAGMNQDRVGRLSQIL
jgi:hypothetical protein